MIRLVVFDMDGVLIDYSSSWAWVHHHFGIDNSQNVMLFFEGKIDDAEFMRRDIVLWLEKNPDLTMGDLKQILMEAPLMNGIDNIFSELKGRGMSTAIISGGVGAIARHLAEKYGIDHVLVNDIVHTENGRILPEGVVRVPLMDKGSVLRELRSNLALSKSEVAVVGDSFIDISMFREAGLKIAFNPMDKDILKYADAVIEEKDLNRVLGYI